MLGRKIKLELNLKKWKAISIYSVFSNIRGKRHIENNRIKGKTPYYSATQTQNGLTDFISNPKFIISENSIIYTTFGDAYFVNKNFTASDEITILKNINVNKFTGLFMCQCLNQNKSKYSFGRKAFSNKISRDKILLPVDESDNPDYKFMEHYIMSKEIYLKKKYNRFAHLQMNDLDCDYIESIYKKAWGEFYITELFEEVKRGKRLTKAQQSSGTIPYISSTSINNGVDNFISYKKSMRKYCNCITIANSGSVGSSFYQPFEFVASDHVTQLKNKKMNKYVYLFITTMLSRLSEKYNFNREINDKRISREKIILPINKNKEPDFEYMEKFVKYHMKKQYNKYLSL